jgi:hypothetical protein
MGVGFLIGGLYPYLAVYLYRDYLVSEGDVLDLLFYFYRFFIVGEGWIPDVPDLGIVHKKRTC